LSKLAAALGQTSLHRHTGLYQRQQLSEVLPLIVDPFGQDGMGYGRTDANGAAYRQLVHMTLALLFKDTQNSDLVNYAGQLRQACHLVGNGDIALGLNQLVGGLSRDLQFNVGLAGASDQVQWNIDQIIGRMQALALHTEYQRLPGSFAIYRGHTAARRRCIDNMRSMLLLGPRLAKKNAEVNEVFGSGPYPLSQAFKDLRLAGGEDIQKLIVAENLRIVPTEQAVTFWMNSSTSNDFLSKDNIGLDDMEAGTNSRAPAKPYGGS